MALAHIYVAEGFEEVELVTIVDILRRAGVEATMVALDEQLTVKGAHGISVEADLPFSAANNLADAIVLPGGGPGTQNMLASAALHQRLNVHMAAGKYVAAICAAPMVLAKAGLLKDKAASCYPGCEDALLEGGATLSAANVITDGLVITSRGPGTAAMFGMELVGLLAGETAATEVGRGMLYI